jgi:hypothetical protein
MKNRAILFMSITLILMGFKLDTVSAQDSKTNSLVDSLNSTTAAFGIMQEALLEQLKALEISSDSLQYYMGMLNEKTKDLQLSFSIPEEIAKEYGDDFEREHNNEIIELKGETKTRNILVNVEKNIPVLFIVINGKINSGTTVIELYDPNNKQLGSFKLQNKNDKNNKSVNNKINKTFKNPIPGGWKVKVLSEKATGNIVVSTIQKL